MTGFHTPGMTVDKAKSWQKIWVSGIGWCWVPKV